MSKQVYYEDCVFFSYGAISHCHERGLCVAFTGCVNPLCVEEYQLGCINKSCEHIYTED